MNQYLAPDNSRWYNAGYIRGVHVGLLIGLAIGGLIGGLIVVIAAWR